MAIINNEYAAFSTPYEATRLKTLKTRESPTTWTSPVSIIRSRGDAMSESLYWFLIYIFLYIRTRFSYIVLYV